ncbi:MAG: ABC transporter ATP-binding protein [Alphaproteobacteria bacterium]|nr:ABC transporter ATP-binding protein [Alphaproteobacteria bacterium]
MIRLEKVSKAYKTPGGSRVVLNQASVTIPSGRNTGILGLNGAGKSTMLRLLAGCELPDSGRIMRTGRVSFPLGFEGGFHPRLTGRQNVAFISRVYGKKPRKIFDFVAEFSELGEYLLMPVGTYSSGMRAKLAFGVCLAIGFDLYLIDEITEVGDARFREKCASYFAEYALNSDIILVSHSTSSIRQHCDFGILLHQGALTLFDDIEEAIAFYSANIVGAEGAMA